MHEDEEWAFDHLSEHSVIEECTAGRAVIDGVVHRVVNVKYTSGRHSGWCTLCDTWMSSSPPVKRLPEFTEAFVDCMACLSAGG